MTESHFECVLDRNHRNTNRHGPPSSFALCLFSPFDISKYGNRCNRDGKDGNFSRVRRNYRRIEWLWAANGLEPSQVRRGKNVLFRAESSAVRNVVHLFADRVSRISFYGISVQRRSPSTPVLPTHSVVATHSPDIPMYRRVEPAAQP